MLFGKAMQRRNHLRIAISAPVIVAILVGLGAWLYVDVLGKEVSERVTMVFAYLFAWPQLVLGPITPRSDSQYPNAALIRIAIFALEVLCVWVTYSLLIYAVLSWRHRRR